MQPALSTPTYHKSPLTSKVNSFHYVIHHMSPLDVILLDHCSHCIARCVTTGTRPREDGQGVRGSEPDKTVAWKRRRKRSRSLCSGTTARRAVLPLSPRSGTTASTTATTTVPRKMLSGSPAVPAGTCLVLPLENINLIRESPPVLPLEQRYYRYLTWNGTTAAPTVLPLPACRSREYSLVSLSHLPLWVKPIYRHLPPPDLERLCFEIRVELDSFFSKVSFLPLWG